MSHVLAVTDATWQSEVLSSDLPVVTRVGAAAGFGDVDTAIAIVDGTGATVAEARGSKAELAGIILDAISAWRTH